MRYTAWGRHCISRVYVVSRDHVTCIPIQKKLEDFPPIKYCGHIQGSAYMLTLKLASGSWLRNLYSMYESL